MAKAEKRGGFFSLFSSRKSTVTPEKETMTEESGPSQPENLTVLNKLSAKWFGAPESKKGTSKKNVQPQDPAPEPEAEEKAVEANDEAAEQTENPVEEVVHKSLGHFLTKFGVSVAVVATACAVVWEEEEAAFEERLAELKRSKGETPYGEGKKKEKTRSNSESVPVAEVDYESETVFYEGSPHSGDLAVNVALGITILWLPLTFAAIGRKAFVRYKFTDKRISVATTAPWESRQTDVSYRQVRDVVAIGRGIGLWGDMVITLTNGDKVEIRSLDRWQEVKAYILQKKAESEEASAKATAARPSGFSS